MRVSPHLHPNAFRFLTTKGYAPPSSTTSVDLPSVQLLLENAISEHKDDYLYVLKPVLLDLLSEFYPHDDVIVTFNEFLSDRYPNSTSESRACALR